MRPLTLLLGLLLAQAQDPEFDVVHLKDGSTRSGFIVEENDATIVLESLMRGSQGQTLGTARQTIDKADVTLVVRASPEALEKSKTRAAAFHDRPKNRRERLAKIVVTGAFLGDAPALSTSGEFVELRSTCDEPFVREAHLALEDVFRAYLGRFKIRRNAGAKVRVYLLADENEYRKFQQDQLGGAVANPAFYHPGKNFIAAYNRVQKAEATRARGEIRAYEERIDEYKKSVRAAEAHVAKEAKDVRRAIEDEAVRMRNEVHKANPRNKDEILRKIDRWKEEQLVALKDRERDIQRDLAGRRKSADAEIEECEKVVARNAKALRAQNELLFRTLFHEGFHAFAQNYLFSEKEIPRWLNEGMASYYETSVVETDELFHGGSNVELLRIFREKTSAGGLHPLADVIRGGPEMFLVTHVESADRSNTSYAQCWALAHYLAGRVTVEQVDRYVSQVAGGADPVAALVEMMEEPLERIESGVRRHVAALK